MKTPARFDLAGRCLGIIPKLRCVAMEQANVLLVLADGSRAAVGYSHQEYRRCLRRL